MEVGPYSFRFGYQKVNISWGERNATVQYRLVKTWTYEPTEEEEEGERSLDDQIIHFNVPLIVSALKAFFQNLLLKIFFVSPQSTPSRTPLNESTTPPSNR